MAASTMDAPPLIDTKLLGVLIAILLVEPSLATWDYAGPAAKPCVRVCVCVASSSLI